MRNYEPRGALVPSTACSSGGKSGEAEGDGGDIFYPRVLEIAEQVGAQVVLVEVGDMVQAVRVAGMVLMKGKGIWEGCEIWRDWPAAGEEGDGEVVEVKGEKVKVRGEGNGRAVLAWKGGDGKRMIGKK